MQDSKKSPSRQGGGEGRKPRRSSRGGRTEGGRGRGRNSGQGRNQGRNQERGPGQGRGQSRGQGRQQNRGRKPQPFKQKAIHLPSTYDVLFYKTLREAEADQERIRARSAAVDQLNVVVEAEDLTEDYPFADVAELFCGAAWTLIHRRRVDDGWYSDRQPSPPAAAPTEHSPPDES